MSVYQEELNVTADDLLAAALAFVRAGVSVIPIDHTTKRPAMHLLPRDPSDAKPTWKPFQERIADETTVRRWFTGQDGAKAFAVVCGKVSGGLLVLDFDLPLFFSAWHSEVGGRDAGLPRQKTGGNGYQVLLRCPNPGGNDKLAWARDEQQESGRTIAIETRGEGGYAVVAPSLHPSGKRYAELPGPGLANIPIVDQACADALLDASRKLDEAPLTRQERDRLQARARDAHRTQHASRNGHASVIDAFNAAHSIESLLEQHGYARGGDGRYVRPGGKSGSVSVKEGRSFHWSSNDPLNDGRVVSGCGCHDAFDVYAFFEHNGDAAKAVKAAAQLLGLNNVHGIETHRNGGRGRRFDDARRNGGGAAPVRVAPIAPYKAFPVDALPAPVAQYVTEGAAAMGCDPAYIALPLMAMLAAAIGNSRRIRLKRSWSEPSVLWAVVVADSGTLKSPAFDLALRPVREWQKHAMKEFERATARYREELETYREAFKAWRKEDAQQRGEPPEEPESPVCERLWCSDTTVEALADRLSKAPRGLLLARDELAGWLTSFNQYKGGKGGDVAHWLEMHRAGHLLSDRKNGDRPTIYVERAAVCLAGGIQPATLQRCLTPEFFENGLAARLLVASPPRRTKKWTEADIDPTTSQELTAVHAGLLALRPTQDLDGGDEPADVALTVGAKALWVEFYNRHAIEQADMGGGELAAAWSKLEGYAARIALVVHCIRQAAGEAGVDPWHLTEQSMAAGIALAEWFGNEAKRVYAMLAESGEARAARELVELIRSMGGRATARDLCQRRRKYRSDAERARQDLQQLVDLGLGRWEHPAPSAQGGRPSEVFVLSQPGTSTAPPWAAPQPDVSETSPQSEVRGEDVYETARASPGDVGIADVDAVDDNADAGQQEGRI